MVWFGSVIWLDLIDFLRQNQLDWIFLSEWNWISQFSSIILINDGDPIKKFFVWLPSWQSSDNWGEIYPCTRKRLNFHFHDSIRFRVQQPNRPRHNPILPSGKEPLPIKTTNLQHFLYVLRKTIFFLFLSLSFLQSSLSFSVDFFNNNGVRQRRQSGSM